MKLNDLSPRSLALASGSVSAFGAYPHGTKHGPRFDTPSNDDGEGGGDDDATIDFSTLTDEQRRQLGSVLFAEIKGEIADAIKEGIKPVGEQLNALAEQVNAKPDDKSKGGDGEEDESPLAAELAEVKKTLGELTSARETETKNAQARKLASGVVEKHHPKLNEQQKAILVGRIVATNPADEDAAESARKSVFKEYTDLGLMKPDAKFGADPDGEGKEKESDGVESEQEFSQRRLKEINERPKPVGF